MAERKWYYIKDNIKMEPVPEETLKQMFQSGELDKDTLVWSDMLTEWLQASKLEVFKREIATRAIPYAQEPPSQQPAKKKGLSQGAKIVIIVGSIVVGLCCIVILVSAIISGVGTKKTSVTTTKETTPTETKTTTEESSKYIFGIPSLVGKNIDEVRSTIGSEPIEKESGYMDPTEEQESLDTTESKEWGNTWEKESYSLVVTYNWKTRKIIDFFLCNSMIEIGDETAKGKLLNVGNLKEDAENYDIEFVKTSDQKGYTGVKAIPK